MAREFGVRFNSEVKTDISQGFTSQSGHGERFYYYSISYGRAEIDKNTKFYIHPDSYSIFEAVQFDIGLSNKDIPYNFDDGEWLNTCDERPDDFENEVVELIQRNNTAFFMPKEEE